MNKIYPIIGMSPGNSYFKDDIVVRLIKKVIEDYGKTVVLIADIPAISTYIALGYPKNRAWRDKALPQGNALRNKVERAKKELGYSDEQVRIIDWENEVENNPLYKEKLKQVESLYQNNSSFQEAANNATKGVLEYSRKEVSNLDEAIKTAVHYLLSEFAFMEFASHYLDAEQVTYVYHKKWTVYESYIAGEFDGVKRTYLTSTTVIV